MRPLSLYAGEPGNGKTTVLLSWLIGGTKIEEWPYWNRVLLIPTTPEKDQAIKDEFKAMAEAKAEAEDVPTPSWTELDFYHRVFAFHHWVDRARSAEAPVEIAIDNLDLIDSNWWSIRNALGENAELVMATISEHVEIRDPGQGMTMKELDEHAGAADQRYRTIREAVKNLKLKPGRVLAGDWLIREGDVTEGSRLSRPMLDRLAHLYFIASLYDWQHTEDPVLSAPAEENSGVAPFGVQMTKDELLGQVRFILESIEGDDSWEGTFAYEFHDCPPERDHAQIFLVQGAVRFGNSMGQGFMRLYREGLAQPKEGDKVIGDPED